MYILLFYGTVLVPLNTVPGIFYLTIILFYYYFFFRENKLHSNFIAGIVLYGTQIMVQPVCYLFELFNLILPIPFVE